MAVKTKKTVKRVLKVVAPKRKSTAKRKAKTQTTDGGMLVTTKIVKAIDRVMPVSEEQVDEARELIVLHARQHNHDVRATFRKAFGKMRYGIIVAPNREGAEHLMKAFDAVNASLDAAIGL